MDGSGRGFTAPTLIVTGGSLDGQTIVLESGAETVLGSAPDSVMPLQLGNVAPAHARLLFSQQALLLSDLESATGTYVNGERITSDHRLSDGDRVCLGPPGSKQSVKLLVRLPETFTSGSSGLDFGSADSAPVLIEGGLDLGLGEPLDVPLQEATPLVLLDPHSGRPVTPVPMRAGAPGITATASDELSGSFAVPAVTLDPAPAPPPERLTAPPPPPKTETRKIKPEYTSEMPSIMSEPDGDGAPVVRPRMPVASVPRRPTAAPRASGVRIGPVEVPMLGLLIGGGLVALLVLGLGLRFLMRPAPEIVGLTPQRAEMGATITITGTGFAASAADNDVRFAGQAGQVQTADTTRLTVKVPILDLSKVPPDVPVTVRVGGKTSKAEMARLYALARIKSIEPELALPGGEITLTLAQLPDGEPKVLVRGQVAEIVEKRLPVLRVRVPALGVALGTSVPVAVQGSGEVGPSAPLVIGKLPLLSGLNPVKGETGTRVTLKGRGFAPAPAGNTVTFAGRQALVTSASATELVVVAPPPPGSETQFAAPVVVSVGDSNSNAQSFALARTSAAIFVLRFFAAPGDGDAARASVATELGPALLLSDRDDATSVGERAVRVAEALNSLAVAAQAGNMPAFELRESPRPGVGVTGGALLVAATAADVAGYQAQAKGVQGSPRTLAAHWNALLQDYFALFVGYRRPSALAELSPRGKVLIDLFADAKRHSQPGALGVPRSLVVPPPASLERDLRSAALVLAGASEKVSVGMVIEGTWTGSMSEPGIEPRPIRMSLERRGAKLGGSVATQSRGLSMAIPLQDVSYDKGVLKFVLVIGGSPRQFTGTLQGATIAGGIGVPGAKEPIGSFTLNFVK